MLAQLLLNLALCPCLHPLMLLLPFSSLHRSMHWWHVRPLCPPLLPLHLQLFLSLHMLFLALHLLFLPLQQLFLSLHQLQLHLRR